MAESDIKSLQWDACWKPLKYSETSIYNTPSCKKLTGGATAWVFPNLTDLCRTLRPLVPSVVWELSPTLSKRAKAPSPFAGEGLKQLMTPSAKAKKRALSYANK